MVRVTPERGTELLFRVTVTPDPRFRRDGMDVYTDANVPFEDAILGGEVEVADHRRAADMGNDPGEHPEWAEYPAQGPGNAESWDRPTPGETSTSPSGP